jgi:hypothetical protein
MRDRIGNVIKENDIVRWDIPPEVQKKIVFQVVRVTDGGIETPSGKTPPVIQLSVLIPVNTERPEAYLEDFLCLRNPESEELLDALSNTKGGKPS